MKVKCDKSSVHNLLGSSSTSLMADSLAKGSRPKSVSVQAFRDKYADRGVFIVGEM